MPFSIARIRKMSWRGLDVDDYLMLVASVSETEKTLNAAVAAAGGGPVALLFANLFLPQVWYTITIVTLNLTAQGEGTALAAYGEDVMALTPDVIGAREKGAKITVAMEQVCNI